MAIRHDARQAFGLVAALEKGRAEVHVIDVQGRSVDGDVDPLQPPRLAGLPRQVMLEVLRDGKPAEDRVAELVAAQQAR